MNKLFWATFGRHPAPVAWLTLLVALAGPGCLALDDFLYAPTHAAANADLFAATHIPEALRDEVPGGLASTGGVQVSTWLLRHDASHPEDTTPAARHASWVLYCHGNNKNLAAFARRIETFWQLGYTVAAFDYRGYGKTPGSPSEAGLYDDGRAVRRWLLAQGAPADRLALYGYSLGAAICTQLATDAATPLLVLEAPFASIDGLARDGSDLGLPRTFFTKAEYNSVGKIGGHRGDLLIFHGERDTYLQPKYGLQLANAAKGHAQSVDYVLVAGADHETVPCRIKGRSRTPPGDCAEGFDPNYLRRVADTLDQAILPTVPLTAAQAEAAVQAAATNQL